MIRCTKLPADIDIAAGPHPDMKGHASSCGFIGNQGFTKIHRYSLAGAAVMLLALGGCGHKEYEDSYPATSGVIVDGEVDGGVDGGINSNQNAAGQATDEQSGTILFVASPGGGKPPQLIARTNSVTSVPTAEFIAREAIAAQRRAPAASNGLIPPLVITENDGDQASPISLPAAPGTARQTATQQATNQQATPQQATTPQAGGSITISQQAGADGTLAGEPTILKIIQAP
jgi:hypothetical protein